MMRSGAGPIFVLCLFAVAVSSTTIPSRARALEGNQEQQGKGFSEVFLWSLVTNNF